MKCQEAEIGDYPRQGKLFQRFWGFARAAAPPFLVFLSSTLLTKNKDLAVFKKDLCHFSVILYAFSIFAIVDIKLYLYFLGFWRCFWACKNCTNFRFLFLHVAFFHKNVTGGAKTGVCRRKKGAGEG
ncbi:MAG: hypothetical protein IJF73_06670, partial [Clostridia bacterium]|nr:hypothetical protein [Clostridia bacterium]